MIRLATPTDISSILAITHEASRRLSKSGIPQWQGGYPNRENFLHDISMKQLYVVTDQSELIGFASISLVDDPNYRQVYTGMGWTIACPSVVIHRLAISEKHLGNGYAQELYRYAEIIAKENQRASLKVDTHLLNTPMRSLLSKLGYHEVGMIKLSHDSIDPWRVAYEKIIK